ncbi:hypothetical protein RJ639_007955 [Escallonia herrerae]|uniref:DYW domain-containing protein n=1 Tax=Escallonia herrerae TaxID=1293975 RepID=A0AA88VWD0_9ASTE|nr:hypothetical protein RJ639_007955 [Escallonia herrerae]
MDAISSSMHMQQFPGNPEKPFTITTQVRNTHLNLHTYAVKPGRSAHALQLFDEMPKTSDTLAWNTLIQTHVRNSDFDSAVATYWQILLRGIRPDRHTLPRILSVSRVDGSLSFGKQLHGHAVKLRLCSDQYVTLYLKENKPRSAIGLFNEMVALGVEIDKVALVTIIGACGALKSLQEGRNVHQAAQRCGLELDVLVSNALLNMYVDCGSMKDARGVFDRMPLKDAILWTAMVRGYVKKGEFNEGLKLFRQMNAEGIKPDAVAISSILPACARMAAHKNGKEIHGCLLRNGIDMNLRVQNALIDIAVMVEDGWLYFYKIRSPLVAHCALMVALLGRAGLFDEARAFIEERQLARHAEVLRALLDGCRIHQNVNTGKRLVEQLCDLEPLNADNFVLLSNWYAHMENWDMVEKSRETIEDMGLRPKKACSCIEFKNKVHVYGTGDVSHPRSERIYWELQSLMEKVEGEGIMTSSDFSLHDVDEERECIPIGHSELLALSFGLISTQAGATIRVTKNLHICRNCHYFVKVISKVVEHEIIIKDPSCFHHFKDGSCSCRDF